MLAVVNHLFGAEFGEEFQPLAASGEFPDPVFGTPVELLVTDKAAYAGTGVHWRRAEAKNVARRVKELVDTGAATAGEIVLLFAAGTDAEWYEEELRSAGLATYRATGRGYFGQQQVVDLLSYLRLLQNRYDDEALVERARVAVRRRLQRRAAADPAQRRAARSSPVSSARCPLISTPTTRGSCAPSGSATTGSRRRRRGSRSSGSASGSSPTTTTTSPCSRSGTAAGATRTCASWRGSRARTRSCAGPTSRASSASSRSRRRSERRERDAVAEEEGADAVRLLTIHAAKGLEFKVVVVADAGRDRNAPSADEILCLADGRFGFRVADPATGKRHGVLGYDSVKEARAAEDEAERLRLYYVAMTRAIDRLIVSGRRLDRSGAEGRRADADRLGAGAARLRRRARAQPARRRSSSSGRAHACSSGSTGRRPPAEEAVPELVAAVVDDATGQLALFAAGEEPKLPPLAPALAPIQALPEPPLHDVRRLSYSALALFERCSYRYYAERVAGMREARAHGTVAGQTGLVATEVGDAVHRLLELVDLSAPAMPDVDQVRAWYPAVTDEELSRIAAFVENYCGSELARRIATLAGARPERPFAFEHDGVLLHGRLDVLHVEGARALVLDYKTNSLAEGTPDEIVEADYRLQRLVYALACFRAGVDEVEVVYHFLERPDAVVSKTFARADLPELEAELSEAIGRIRAGEFVPTPSEFNCAGCPALDVVCAGPRLRGGPSRPPALAAAG